MTRMWLKVGIFRRGVGDGGINVKAIKARSYFAVDRNWHEIV